MNVLNIDALAYLRKLDEYTVKFLAGAMGSFDSNPAFAFVSRRVGYELFSTAVDTLSYLYLYPVADPEVNAVNNFNLKSFFYGDCFLSFYLSDLPADAAPWYLKVYSESVSNDEPDGDLELLYYASNIVNPLQENEVVRITPPRIPTSAIRIELYHNGVSSPVINSMCSWVGLFVPRAFL